MFELWFINSIFMGNESFAERLKRLIYYMDETINSFAVRLGTSFSVVKNYIEGRDPSYAFIVKILKQYPNISPEWLVMGTGDMLRTPTPTPTNSVSVDSISGDNAVVGNNVNIATIKDYEQTIQELKERVAELKKDKENLNRLVEIVSRSRGEN